MVTSNNKLLIFENFQINQSLPKFNKNIVTQVQLGNSVPLLPVTDSNGIIVFNTGTGTNSWSTATVCQGSDGSIDLDVKKNSNIFSKLFGGFMKKRKKIRS